MSLDKAIRSGQEHREPFVYERKRTKAKSVDKSCHNHGSCKQCWGTRTYSDRRARSAADEDYEAWKRGELEDSEE